MLSPRDAALDIETTGLSFVDNRITTIAVVSNLGDDIAVFDNPYDEEDVLFRADRHIREGAFERIATWNGSEFDLPFIAIRKALNGRPEAGGPHLRPMIELWDGQSAPPHICGKYGKPRYSASWWGASLVDVAYMYEQDAKDHGTFWSLKPMAKEFKVGIELPFEVDFQTQWIMDLTVEERELYCASDAQQTLLLWGLKEERTKGAAVLFEGPLTIL